WTALAQAPTPAEALALAGRLRILTAVREGPQGARGLNTRIEALLAERLAQQQPRTRSDGFFHGRLLLVTENHYRHGLFNGDIGICLRDDRGQLMAWFPGATPDAPRAFHPATLPAHDSAFAMTVHKAQGSEFDEVWLVLPGKDSRVLSRELVYTGLTRARDALHLCADPALLALALSRHVSRVSGLAWRLCAADLTRRAPGAAACHRPARPDPACTRHVLAWARARAAGVRGDGHEAIPRQRRGFGRGRLRMRARLDR